MYEVTHQQRSLSVIALFDVAELPNSHGRADKITQTR